MMALFSVLALTHHPVDLCFGAINLVPSANFLLDAQSLRLNHVYCPQPAGGEGGAAEGIAPGRM
jgi:hypothetical protein